MKMNAKRRIGESPIGHSKFPSAPYGVVRRNNLHEYIDAIADCTHAEELKNTSAYSPDPYKEFGLINMKTKEINCAIIDGKNKVTGYDCYSYDIVMCIGANKLKVISYDFDKILIYSPEENPFDENTISEAVNKGKLSLAGTLIVVGIDWRTDSFTPLTRNDFIEIKNHFSESKAVEIR